MAKEVTKTGAAVDFQGRQPLSRLWLFLAFKNRADQRFTETIRPAAISAGTGCSAWLEIEYTGQEIIGNLREQIVDLVAGSRLEIRRIKNRRIMERVLSQNFADEILDDLEVLDVFERCLDSHQVSEIERNELRRLFQ